MEEEPEILTLLEVQYADLLLLSSDSSIESSSDQSFSDRPRLDSISRMMMETLGPTGPGLLSIAGVPNSLNLRRKILPLARKLALLNHEDRKRILKEHRLGSDVPLKSVGRNVSSFAMKLKYSQGKDGLQNEKSVKDDLNSEVEQDFGGKGRDEFEDLGDTFEQLGKLMIDLGIQLARVCDRAIGGQELEKSLMESSTAKGRLIHYHSALDNLIIQKNEARQRKVTPKSRPKHENKKGVCINTGMPRLKDCQLKSYQTEADMTTGQCNLWQQWHYDYGIFTVLTDPLFISSRDSVQTLKVGDGVCSSDREIESPTGHTCLQVLDTYRDKLVSVKSSPESFLVQVGESADILSKGKLCATLHSVSRSRKIEKISRETFVVFLQPAWSKIFTLQNNSTQTVSDHDLSTYIDDNTCRIRTRSKLVKDIQSTIPPLSFRLKDGMTFADFSRETTKQYYGGSGLQSNR